LLWINVPIFRRHINTIYSDEWIRNTFGNPGYKLISKGLTTMGVAFGFKYGFSQIDLEHQTQ